MCGELTASAQVEPKVQSGSTIVLATKIDLITTSSVNAGLQKRPGYAPTLVYVVARRPRDRGMQARHVRGDAHPARGWPHVRPAEQLARLRGARGPSRHPADEVAQFTEQPAGSGCGDACSTLCAVQARRRRARHDSYITQPSDHALFSVHARRHQTPGTGRGGCRRRPRTATPPGALPACSPRGRRS